MPKISPALRQRLLDQKKSMQRGGMLIRNKDVRRLKLRILPPPEGEVPGVQNVSFFSKPLNKGTTSPLNWGVHCPVNDALDRIWREGSKEDKEVAKLFCRRNVEYWIPVIDRSDEGTPQNPKLRILAGKETVYQQITDWLLDEDEDEDDITDPIEGRDVVVKKKGEGLDTKWTIEKSDRSPISEDEDMANAWVELASTFDVRSRFYPPKLDVLKEMYEGLTGEKLPPTYLDPIKELVAKLEAGGHVDPELEHGAADADPDAEVEEVDAAATEVEDQDLTGQIVQFDNAGQTVQGQVTGPDTDEKGSWLVVEDGGDPDAPWSIPEALLTVVEPEAAEELEVAEEVVEAPKIVKKTLGKPAAPTKPAPVQKVAPAKVAPKPVPAAMPRKPGAVPTASAAIKGSLKARAAGKK